MKGFEMVGLLFLLYGAAKQVASARAESKRLASRMHQATAANKAAQIACIAVAVSMASALLFSPSNAFLAGLAICAFAALSLKVVAGLYIRRIMEAQVASRYLITDLEAVVKDLSARISVARDALKAGVTAQ